MTKLNENLSTLLDITPISIEDYIDTDEPKELEVIENNIENVVSDTISDDTEFARTNIKSLIDKGNIAMDQLLHVAKESEHPRAYEVVSNLIKNLSELNKDLLEIQKYKRDLGPKEYSGRQQNINVDKAVVFTGSTTELIKLIKQNKEV
jgi:hypothetical protein